MANLSDAVFLFAHGAGAGMDSDFIVRLSGLLNAKGLDVKTFEFPYMQKIRVEGKRRPPDRMAKLLIAYEQAILSIATGKQIFIGGKSMGGRVASLLAAQSGSELADQQKLINGVICLGFPFHPPKKPDSYRGDHLSDIDIDTLIVQGERDSFGTQSEVVEFEFSERVQLEFLPDGDHSFKPRVRSGFTLEQNLTRCSNLIVEFVETQLRK